MRFWSLFPALHVYLSDTERTRKIRRGMAGLRHKSRHRTGGQKRGHFTDTSLLRVESPSLTQLQPSVGVLSDRTAQTVWTLEAAC
jgi:hypothetical protein